MSSNDEPFANGFGVLLGLVVLWVGTIALCLVGKTVYDGFFSSDGEATEATADGDLQSRAAIRESLFSG